MVVGAIAIVLGVSVAITSMSEKKARKSPRAEKPEVTVVSPARTTGVEGMSTELAALKKGQEELFRKFAKQGSDGNGSGKKDANKDDELSSVDTALDIPSLTPQTSVFEAPTSRPPTLPPPPPSAPSVAHAATDAPAAPVQPAMPSPGGAAASQQAENPSASRIRVVTARGELTATQVAEVVKKPEVAAKAVKGPEGAFIPAGSMFTGVLLNGLDAPTSSVAQKNPTPIVIRVKREALLPNFASIDVRECFLMAAGYGQLSSERAMARAESLSCVRADGQVIENKLDAYIVGSDGKVGIQGRLVSKQGQMIAQTLMAGALGGVGQALTRSRVPSLNINPAEGENLYQSESMSSVGQSGLAGGISSSANMIAKFYLDMAKETFPVVEVPAGEVATIIVTRGTNLPLKGSTNLQKFVDPNEKQRGNNARRDHDDVHQESRATPSPANAALGMAQHSAAGIAAGVANAKKPTFENGLGWQ
ncbi:TraB/VirB10 family protein [Acidovorax sp. sic0104]|nr:TraB/VirB10 family protein [Acidovorax sp. sic0104]